MEQTILVWALIGIALILANLPWVSDLFFFVFEAPGGHKGAWLRLLEWFVYFLITGGLALGAENRAIGAIHDQDWEFYAVALSLFAVFAAPSFVWRYQFRPLLQRHRGWH